MTNFTKLYSHLILKSLVTNLAKDRKAKAKSIGVATVNSQDYHSIRSQRHWQSVASYELLGQEIEKGYSQLKELDQLTRWSDKLHQDRFKFMEKYGDVLEEYEKWYKGR